jgi:hypothetical protein
VQAMLGPKDPFEQFREKREIEKLAAKAKGESGEIQAPGVAKKKTGRPAVSGDKNWIY